MKARALFAALAVIPTLGGCVVAAVPLLASGTIVRGRLSAARTQAPAPAPASARTRMAATTVGAATPLTTASVPAARPPARAVPDTMRYLYGSAEAAALSVQAYQTLAAYVTGPVAYTKPEKQRQVVLSEGSTLDKPYFEACAGKKPAVVLDIDETALLNLGYEADAAQTGAAFDAHRWSRWEATGADKVVAVPGATAALDAIRRANVTVIFNSNRSSTNADATERAIAGAGVGPAKHQDTLFLKGDDGGTGSGKDVRRWAIASGYCVVAMVGDQLGDFSDLFNDPTLSPLQRRAIASSAPFARLWGSGWFLLPNPVYGPAVAGGLDDVFPQDRRWHDDATQGAKP